MSMSKYRKLFGYISYFENTTKEEVCRWGGGEKRSDGVITMPYPIYDEHLINFVDEVYKTDLIDHSYMETLKKYRLPMSNELINAIDSSNYELAKAILTCYVRQERTQENNEKKFYRLLQIISFLPIQKSFLSYETPYSREILFSQLSEAIDFSNINFAMTLKNGEIIFHPKGEVILDKVLVDEVISFLNIESQKHFIDALNFYSNFSVKNAIKSAESIRRSLEEFLRFKLQNQKGLKENIIELQKRLKGDKRDPFLRNIIFQTFTCLDQYFNENSKHKDGDINKPENEFLIYQIGLLMRYIHNVIS